MSPKSAEEEYTTVHMLQAARLPGRHEKLVKLQFNKQDVVSTGDFSRNLINRLYINLDLICNQRY